jgi:hypothetical protein
VNGPLALAIPMWRNSFVPTELERITSVVIHYLPILVTFVWRWTPSGNGLNLTQKPESLSFSTALSLPVLFYIGWQVFYLLITEVLHLQKFRKDPELSTSLRWMANPTKSGFLSAAVLKGMRASGLMKPNEYYDSESWKTKFAFIGTQLVYTIATFMITPLLYNYYWCHVIFVILMTASALWNGASYYSKHQYSLNDFKKWQKKQEEISHSLSQPPMHIIPLSNKRRTLSTPCA